MPATIRSVATLGLALALAFAFAQGPTTTYQNDAYGFIVEHPADWEALEGGAERNIVDLFDDTGLGFATVAVYALDDLGDVLPTLDAETLIDVVFDGHVMFAEDAELREGESVEIAGVSALVRHFDATSTQGSGAPITGSLYVALTDDLLVVISVQANTSAMAAYRPAFDGIVASFVLTR